MKRTTFKKLTEIIIINEGDLQVTFVDYLSLPPLCGGVAHLYCERAACGNVAVLNVWQVVGFAVERYALDVDICGAVVYCLNDELAAFDGELGAVNGW